MLAPQAQDTAEVPGQVAKMAMTATLSIVDCFHSWCKQDDPIAVGESQTDVGVFAIQKETLIKSVNCPEVFTPEEHEHTSYPIWTDVCPFYGVGAPVQSQCS